ncbi:GDSL-type esterase/lipase family protein [Thalassotalea atypica]|uniref:GDSL-type esterase/lipase family protein n=1 Tax=Thalassotalea atypica TaxID=2054316 RepID=UPI0025746F47|nr:GDSL-type esterase/lipase family protein [Thalassotalea atypica]
MYDIVMIGSSIFEFWQQPKFDKLIAKNCAIRSTQTKDWLDKSYDNWPASSHMLIYCGSNDLIFGNTPKQITRNVCALLDKLSAKFPNTRLGYFSIMQCPQKTEARQFDVIKQINNEINAYCAHQYDFFNFNDFIENDPKWFVDDGLHLTAQAYQMLTRKLSPVLSKWVNTTR